MVYRLLKEDYYDVVLVNARDVKDISDKKIKKQDFSIEDFLLFVFFKI